MDARAFKTAVFDKAPRSLSREALDAVIQSFLAEGKNERCHISDCIQAAYAYELEAAAEGNSTFHLPAHVFPAAQGELLVRQVEAWIESIRRDIFGKDEPPFRSYQSAVRWIEREVANQPKRSEKNLRKARALECEVIDKLREIARLSRYPAKYVKPLPLSIPYGDFPNRQVKYLAVTGDKPLGPLAEKSLEVAEKTGFRQIAVVAWILAGMRPALPGTRLETTARVTMTPAGEIVTRRARIDIFSPDVKAATLAKLCEKARADLRPLKLSARNRLLLEVMEEIGDLKDDQEKRDYWEAVRIEYNRGVQSGTPAYSNWEGPRRAFMRLDAIYKGPFPRLTAKGRQG